MIRILRRLCGSLIEVVPPHMPSSEAAWGFSSQAGETRTDRFDGGDSVVRLTHQTVKDFLASSHHAGPLSFTEQDALLEILLASQTYIKLILPTDDVDVVAAVTGTTTQTGQSDPAHWSRLLHDLVQELDEFRLFPLCSGLLNTFRDTGHVKMENMVHVGGADCVCSRVAGPVGV